MKILTDDRRAFLLQADWEKKLVKKLSIGTYFVIKSNLNCLVRVWQLSGYIFLGFPLILNDLCWIFGWILWLLNFTYQRKLSNESYQLSWSANYF